MLFDERGTRYIRIWEEAHPHLGRDAPVSGPRNDRIWDLKRLNARRRSPTNRDSKFSCCFFYDCCLVKLILIDRYISRCSKLFYSIYVRQNLSYFEHLLIKAKAISPSPSCHVITSIPPPS